MTAKTNKNNITIKQLKTEIKLQKQIKRNADKALHLAHIEKTLAEEIRLHYQLLAEAIPNLVFRTNTKGRPLYFNSRWLEYTGLTLSDIIKRNTGGMVHPEDRKMVQKTWKETVKNKSSFEVEYRLLGKNKVYKWFLVRSYPVYDEERFVGWFGTATDIDEQKKILETQKFLAEASTILSSSLEFKDTLQNVANSAVPHIADWCGVDIMREDGTLEQVAVAHKDPKQVKWAKEFRKTNPPHLDDSTGVPQVLRKGKSEFYPLITDEMLVATAKNDKDLALARKLKLTSIMIVPLFSNKNAIGALTFITTENKKQYSQSDLIMAEALATRASIAIDNARLYQEAQRLIRLQDEFISMASHELKTPVTSLKVYTQVMQRYFNANNLTKASEYFDRINDQANKLNSLIGDLLDVSRVQTGKLRVEKAKFNIDELILDTMEAIQETTRKHTIVVKSNKNQMILGDRYRIYQVLVNLLTNAIKYSPQGGTITITAEVIGGIIKIGVKDEGIGIEKKFQNKIFERLYQVTDPEEKTYPGLGIGLYISHEIIKMHDGKLWVESQKGKGSTFFFTLPVTK